MEKKLRFDFLDVNCCPYCASNDFKKDGSRNFKQRYRCKNCGKTFYATTGTVFAATKKNERKWRDFVIQMTNESTLLASHEYSGVSRNTSLLWRRKLFACFVELNEDTILHDIIWFDEIYCNVSNKERIYTENGTKLRGISKNKIGILLALDNHGNHFARVMKRGKPNSKDIDEAVDKHFAENSIIYHDEFHEHGLMLTRIKPKQIITCNTRNKSSLKLMQPINQFCAYIRHILELHNGERPDHLQEYVSYACFKQRLKKLPVKERRIEVLRLCAMTRVIYKRHQKPK